MQMRKTVLALLRLLSLFRLFPNRLALLRIGPQKLIEFNELVRMTHLNPDDTVLDIGCGTGIQTLLLGRRCKSVLGIDVSTAAIEKAKALADASMLSSRVRFVQGDVAKADFKKNSFTKIVSFCVLEHIPDWQQVLRNAYEWLAPGGYLLVSVDSLATIKGEDIIDKHRKKHSVVIYFDNQTLASALRDASFSHVELRPILRSNYAKEQFERSVVLSEPGRPNALRLLIEYARLRKAEKVDSNKDEGIFLIAKAAR